MNIPVTAEVIKCFFEKFKEKGFDCLEQEVFRSMMELGRSIMKSVLETMDLYLMSEFDRESYRNKGLRKTTVKTLLGEVEYSRRIYQSLQEESYGKYVYLLDEYLGSDTIGFISGSVSRLIVAGTTQGTFRSAAASISSLTGLSISHQACWNITQKAGELTRREHEKDAVKAENQAAEGKIETAILYEEKDGIYLPLQGKDRESTEKGKLEMKVGIAYDGVRREKTGKGYRKRLDHKVAYAGFLEAKEFRRQVNGVIGSVYNTGRIRQWILNGDGAGWIRGSRRKDGLYVLDEFHRNKALTEKLNVPSLREEVRALLYAGEAEKALRILEASIESTEDEKERKDRQELYTYFKQNRDGLTDYRQRGIEIEATRTEEVYHANLGSMESNIFTLIGNRMKGKRMSWSVRGGNNMAALLCLRHTGRMDRLFMRSSEWCPEKEEEDEYPLPLSAGQVPQRVGKGKLFYKNADLTDSPAYEFLMKIAHGNML